MSDTAFMIVRFHVDGPAELISTGWTLEEAQEHCNDPSTRGTDWFDGYIEEEE